MPIPIVLFALAFPIFAQGSYAPRADLEEGRYLKALAEADLQIKLNPNNSLAWAAKAHALSALLRFSEALATADRALGLNPTLADAYLARGLARGGFAIQQRNFGSLRKAAGALDDLRRATELDPSLPTAWMSLGLGYQQLPGILGGSTRKALKCAEALRKTRPSWGDLLQGMILSLNTRWNEAEPYFIRALATGATDSQVVSGYLECLGSRETRDTLGASSQQARLVQEARRLLPGLRSNARGLEAICGALLDGGKAEEAWAIALEALPRVEAPSILRLELGKISARGKVHRDEGLAFLTQAILAPLEGGTAGAPGAWWRKGQILQDLGQLQQARACAEEALKIDPKHPGARRLLEDLD